MLKRLKKLDQNKKNQIFIFIVCFCMHEIFNPLLRTITSIPTELAAFSVASRLGGYDWSSLMASTEYYGTGFFSLFFPLFLLIKNSYVLHQVLLAIVVVIACIPSILCYRMMTQYFKITNGAYAVIVSITVSFLSVARTSVAINEHPLTLILWIVLYMLIAMYHTEDQKKRIIYSVLIALLMGYSLTIHTRAITLIIAVVLTVAVYYIVYRKWIISVIPFGVTTAVMWFASKQYNSIIVKKIWSVVSSGELKNSESTLLSGFDSIKLLFSNDGIKGFLNICLGQFFSATIYTGGIFILIFCVGVFLGVKNFKYLLWNKKKADVQTNDNVRQYSIVMLICLACIVATILMHGFLSLNGAIISVQAGSGAKSYFYLRYFFYYISPAFMVAMCVLKEKSNLFKKYWLIVVATFVLCTIYIFLYIVPTVITGPTLQLDKSQYFSALSLRMPGEYLTQRHFFVCTVIVLCLLCAYYVFLKKRKVWLISLVMLLLLVYEYSYLNITNSVQDANAYYDLMNGFLEKVYDNPELDDAFKKLYYKDNGFAVYAIQFEMLDKEISYTLPSTEDDEAVLLSNNIRDEEEVDLSKDYMVAQLDDNEYVYVKGAKLQQKFIDAGIPLESFTAYTSKIWAADISTQTGSVYYDENYKEDVLESSGAAGYLSYETNIDLQRGEYKVSFDLELIKKAKNEVGEFSMRQDETSGVIKTIPITQSDFDADGKYHFEGSVSCNNVSGMDICVYVNEGTVLKMTGIEYQYVSDKYDFISEDQAQASVIAGTYNQLGLKNDIVYVSADNKHVIDSVKYDYINGLLDGMTMSGTTYSEFSDRKNSDVQYVIIDNDYEKIFELLPEYMIINKTKSYTMLVKNSEQMLPVVENSGIEPMSDGNKIELRYFAQQDNGAFSYNYDMSLSDGVYVVSVLPEAEADQGYISLNRDGEEIETLPIDADATQDYTFEYASVGGSVLGIKIYSYTSRPIGVGKEYISYYPNTKNAMAFIKTSYARILTRQALNSELCYWGKEIGNDPDKINDFLLLLLQSEEFLHGNTSPEDQVVKLYQGLLNRVPEDDESRDYVNRISQGENATDVIDECVKKLMETEEFQERIVSYELKDRL